MKTNSINLYPLGKLKDEIPSITGEELIAKVKENPDWAQTLTEPLRITTVPDFKNSPIRHLSEHLIFEAVDKEGRSATFTEGNPIFVLQGKFLGYVNGELSRISSVKNFESGRNSMGDSLNLTGTNVRSIEGIAHGYVSVAGTPITNQGLSGLTITQPDKFGNALSAHLCKELKCLTNFSAPGHIDLNESNVAEIENVTIDLDPEFTGKTTYISVCGTPFEKENPIEAAELLFNSKDPNVWIEMKETIILEAEQSLMVTHALNLSKLKGTVKTPGNQNLGQDLMI
jgi:hypothetical protein